MIKDDVMNSCTVTCVVAPALVGKKGMDTPNSNKLDPSNCLINHFIERSLYDIVLVYIDD